MANPSSITINELTANGSIARPAVQTLDTAGMVPINAGGKGFDRIILECVNADDAAATLVIGAGDNPPAIQSASLSVAFSATGGGTDAKILGPFSSSQFAQNGDDAGEIHLTLSGGASPSMQIRCYRLPKYV